MVSLRDVPRTALPFLLSDRAAEPDMQQDLPQGQHMLCQILHAGLAMPDGVLKVASLRVQGHCFSGHAGTQQHGFGTSHVSTKHQQLCACVRLSSVLVCSLQQHTTLGQTTHRLPDSRGHRAPASMGAQALLHRTPAQSLPAPTLASTKHAMTHTGLSALGDAAAHARLASGPSAFGSKGADSAPS